MLFFLSNHLSHLRSVGFSKILVHLTQLWSASKKQDRDEFLCTVTVKKYNNKKIKQSKSLYIIFQTRVRNFQVEIFWIWIVISLPVFIRCLCYLLLLPCFYCFTLFFFFSHLSLPDFPSFCGSNTRRKYLTSDLFDRPHQQPVVTSIVIADTVNRPVQLGGV